MRRESHERQSGLESMNSTLLFFHLFLRSLLSTIGRVPPRPTVVIRAGSTPRLCRCSPGCPVRSPDGNRPLSYGAEIFGFDCQGNGVFVTVAVWGDIEEEWALGAAGIRCAAGVDDRKLCPIGSFRGLAVWSRAVPLQSCREIPVSGQDPDHGAFRIEDAQRPLCHRTEPCRGQTK